MDHEMHRYAAEESAYMNARTDEMRDQHLYEMVESLARQVAMLRTALAEEIKARLDERGRR